MDNSIIVALKNIVVDFDGEPILTGLSLDIHDKEFVTLLGPSGCGKTTTLRVIGGFVEPRSGNVFFAGRDITRLPPYKRQVNTVFQKYALFPHLNVFENVAFGLRIPRTETEEQGGKTVSRKVKLSKGEIHDRVMEMLEVVNLKGFEKRPVSALSGGQQQRVAFARAIVIQPECILFDEPLSALDALLREEMRTELTSLINRLKITAVFVTHDQMEAMSMSDMIAVMSRGTVEQYDTPENIYQAPATEFVGHFVGSANWIDEHHMFRPEKASLDEGHGDMKVMAQVLSNQFLGDTYQVHLRHEDRQWKVLSDRSMSVGIQIPIYIKKNDIITV